MTIRAWWRAGALAVLSTAPLAACLDEKSTGPRSDDSPSLQTTRTTRQGTSPHHIVVMRAGIPANFAAVVRSLNGRVVRSHRQIGVVSVAGLSTQAAARLARQPGVEAVSLTDASSGFLPPAVLASRRADGSATRLTRAGRLSSNRFSGTSGRSGPTTRG
jgi:hypothetical protein